MIIGRFGIGLVFFCTFGKRPGKKKQVGMRKCIRGRHTTTRISIYLTPPSKIKNGFKFNTTLESGAKYASFQNSSTYEPNCPVAKPLAWYSSRACCKAGPLVVLNSCTSRCVSACCASVSKACTTVGNLVMVSCSVGMGKRGSSP